MPTEWFYQVSGDTIGPLTSSEFLKKVREGAVGNNTLVRKDDSQWVEAGEVNGLFESATKDRVFKCPFCSTVIERPPSTCVGCKRWIEFTPAYQDPVRETEVERRTPAVVQRVKSWVRNLLSED